MSGERLLLAVALVLPVVSVAVRVMSSTARHGAQAALAGSAVAWGALVVRGTPITWGWFHVDPLVGAACCGAVLVVLAVDVDGGRRVTAPMGSALVGAVVGLAVGLDGGPAFVLVLGLAVVVLLAAAPALDWLVAGFGGRDGAGPENPDLNTALAVLGCTLGVLGLGLGLVLAHGETDSWALPRPGTETLPTNAVVALVLGAVFLAAAGAERRQTPLVVLTAAAGAVALRAISLLAPERAETVRALAAVVVAAAAVAVLGRRRAMTLLLFGVSVALAHPRLVPAGALLVAAGVLAQAVGRPVVLYAAVPGAVALVLAAHDSGDGFAAGVAIAGGGLAAAVAWVTAGDGSGQGPADEDSDGRMPRVFDLAAAPAMAAAVWLTVAPGSWSWAGEADLSAYDEGAARAAAAGFLAVVLVAAWQAWRTGEPPPLVQRVRAWYARLGPNGADVGRGGASW